MVLSIPYTSREEWLASRLKDVTSTEVSSLFDMSPYMSLFELWHLKKSKMQQDFQENERMLWGNVLEPAIAEQIALDYDLEISPLKVYMRDEENRMGSSFDFSIDRHPTIQGKGILEIKNVDGLVFKNKWIKNEDGSIEAPPHIELQCQHQLAVSGREYLFIGVLVGGNNFHFIERRRSEKIISSIKERVANFWESIETNVEPHPDFQRDSSFITSMYQYASEGKELYSDEVITTLADKYKVYSDQEKEAKKKKEGIKAELLIQIKDAEKVIGDKFTISAGMVSPSQVSYERKAYRSFRINWKKKL